jgi:hypothetical protein
MLRACFVPGRPWALISPMRPFPGVVKIVVQLSTGPRAGRLCTTIFTAGAQQAPTVPAAV